MVTTHKKPCPAFLLMLAVILPASPVSAATQTQVQLILDRQMASPGDIVWAGFHFQLAPNWHTYWQNPGDAGEPAAVTWSLPDGLNAGVIHWPVPEKHVEADLVSIVYYREVVLLVPLTLGNNLPSGPCNIKADVSWLECEKLCVPREISLTANLLIGNQSTPSPQATLIGQWKERLPRTADNLRLEARWHPAAADGPRLLEIRWTTQVPPTQVDFFPLGGEGYEIAPAADLTTAVPGNIQLGLKVKKTGGSWPSAVAGLLVVKGDSPADATGYDIKLVPQEARPTTTEGAWGSFLIKLLYAFLGGLILNIMPCVLPVIALKILGFVNQSRESRQQIRVLGMLYAAGVLVSFLVLAGVVIGVQQAGQRASWGMQFGNPQFLVVLCALITLVALNLFGVFEVALSGRLMGTAGEWASREGKTGAFFNGVLATALATPCTAPFLGTALGFAFVQPPLVITLFFVMVGIGLATPYVILSWQPGWLAFIPRPGPWMVRFKVAMGFPMLATALWLFFLAADHYGKRSLWLGFFLVFLALAAWIHGEFVQRGRSRQGLARGVVLVLLAGGYLYALENQLRWRSPDPAVNRASASLQETPDGIPWQKWSPDAVVKARSEGKAVFVDFTADWCLTCSANKKFSIEIPSVRSKLKEIGAVAFLGDYTKSAAAPEITAELSRFGRAGVPLVLVYPRQPDRPPLVLPELLTPQIVLNALEEAAR